MFNKVIAFDVWGDYAMFRYSYTNASEMTYDFPPRTTISGLIACILGYEQNSYHDVFSEENSLIGLRIMNPVNKINFNYNNLNTKTKRGFLGKAKNPRLRVHSELLKDVKYRIYVSFKDEDLLEELFNMLKEHRSVYTPYLGKAFCNCDFKLAYPEIFDLTMRPVDDEGVNIDSVLVSDGDNYSLIKNNPNKTFATIKHPGYMNNDRVVTKYINHIYVPTGDSVKITSGCYCPVGEDNIVLY